MKKDDCIFCKIANGDIPTTTIYEDEDFRAILDLGPASKGHTLILPKEHYRNLLDLPEEVYSKVLGVAKKICLSYQRDLKAEGFNIVQNNEEIAGQTVMHYHLHIIPRYTNGPSLPLWNPGKLSEEEAKEVSESVNVD